MANVSPDGEYIALASSEGLWVMRAEGSELTYVAGVKFAASSYWREG